MVKFEIPVRQPGARIEQAVGCVPLLLFQGEEEVCKSSGRVNGIRKEKY